MIGQEALQKELFSQSLQYSRKTILFLGEYGCGKHTLVKELANHFGLDLYDITDSISAETLEEIRFRSVPAFYLVDLDKLNERSQNVLLKCIEEPSDTAYMLLISSNKNYVLDTILNRCLIYTFSAYSKEELVSITGCDISDELLDVCTTPGQIKISSGNFDKLKNLCLTIVNKLDKASLSNALSIANKINYKDEYDKFDLSVFLKVLMKELYSSYIESDDAKSRMLYNIVSEQSQRLLDVRLNKEIFVQHLIVTMWKAVKGV